MYVNDREVMSFPFSFGTGGMFPTSDSPGNDLDRIPRFPESIRLNFSKEGTSLSVQYLIKGSNLNDVTRFYKEEMQKIAWKLESEQAIPAMNIPFAPMVSQGGWTLSFNSDEGETAYLQIDEGGISSQDLVIMVVAEYSPGSYAEVISKVLPESVPRLLPEIPMFPDSLRVSQSKQFGGMSLEEYNVLGNRVFEIYEFYKEKLKDWETIQEDVNPNEVSLTYQKEAKQETKILMIFINYSKPNTSIMLQLTPA
jgi:hypothetical protein